MPMRAVLARHATAIAVASALALGAATARAQQADSARIGIAPARIEPSSADAESARRDSILLAGPPIRPKTALLRSLVIPGWGQASLDRGTAGATYFALEAGSIATITCRTRGLVSTPSTTRSSIGRPAMSMKHLWETPPARASGSSLPRLAASTSAV